MNKKITHLGIDSIGFILENAYHCKVSETQFGRLLEWRIGKESDWQQMEIGAWVWDTLKARHKEAVEKWEAGLDEQG
jgi:hypothetical protein